MEIRLGYTIENGADSEAVVHETLVRIWKLTNHHLVNILNGPAQKGDLGGKLNDTVNEVKRLNYRSWRLLQIGTGGDGQTLREKFSPIMAFSDVEAAGTALRDAAPLAKQFLNRDNSLFLDISTRSTLFSHQSSTRTDHELEIDHAVVKGGFNIDSDSDSDNVSGNDSESDISDISEVDEEDDYYDSESEDDDVDLQQDHPATVDGSGANEGTIGTGEAGTPGIPEKVAGLAKSPRSKTSFVRGFSPNNVSISFIEHDGLQQLSESNHLLKRNAPDSQNIFYIANSPSPTENNSKISSTRADGSGSGSTSGPSSGPVAGSGSTPSAVAGERLRSDSLFQSSPKKLLSKAVSHRSCSLTDISENHNDNDSAWQSVSSEDEEEEEILNRKEELVFSKRSIELPVRASTDSTLGTRSEGISIAHSNTSGKNHHSDNNGGSASGSGGSYQPRSLLSGLFLHRMAEKPVLKRSSTTDVVRAASSSYGNLLIVGSDKKKQSLLFDNNLSGSSEGTGSGRTKTNSLLDFKRYSYNAASTNEEYLPLAKKDSIVGISDFNVLTQTPKSLSMRSNSTVDIIAEETGGTDLILTPNYSNGVGSDVETLSSSLNKYSARRSNSSLSINGLLLKSSMNLSGFFRNGNGNNGTKVNSEGGGDGMLTSRRSFVKNGMFKKKDESPKTVNKSTKSELQFPIAEDERDKIDTAPLKLPATSVKTDKMAVKTPKPTSKQELMRSNLSTELSESLKDSIIIDYKLGKIPLPEKVIESRKFEKFVVEDEGDDYHSKGW